MRKNFLPGRTGLPILLCLLLTSISILGAEAASQDPPTGSAAVAIPSGGHDGLDIGRSLEQLETLRSRYLRHRFTFDARDLDDVERRMLAELRHAADLVERVYWEQVDPEGRAWRERLAASTDPRARTLVELLDINAGPYDRLEQGRALIGDQDRPPGAGFFPPDLDRATLDRHLADQEASYDAVLDPRTVVRRAGDGLRTEPYHRVYARWTEGAAEALERAAEAASDDHDLTRFLRASAGRLRNDSWEGANVDWFFDDATRYVVQLNAARSWLDRLTRRKAAYSMSVGRVDREATARAARFVRQLDALERRLPLDDRFKRQRVSSDLDFVVVDELLRGGEIARGHRESQRLRGPAVEGRRGDGRHILWRNITEVRFEHLFRPKAAQVLDAEALADLDLEAYFDTLIAHRVAHALGTVETWVEGEPRPLEEVFGDDHGTLDETRAEALGLLLLGWMVESGELGDDPELPGRHVTAALAHALLLVHHSTIPGTAPRWARAGRLLVGWFEHHGVLGYDPVGERWHIDHARLPVALEMLVAEILEIQVTGDLERAKTLLARSADSERIDRMVSRLSQVRPVQVEPIFTIEGLPEIERAPGLSLADVARLRSVGELALAPDGRRVVYTLRVPRRLFDEPDGRPWLELHGRDLETGTHRVLLDGPVAILHPGWSADGRVTFLARLSGHPQTALYTISPAGGDPELLYGHQGSLAAYALSPQGRRLAFVTSGPEPAAPSAVVAEAREHGFEARVHGPPARRRELWVVELGNGAEPRRLELAGSVSDVSWSPSGDRLALALAPTASADDTALRRRVVVVEASTGEVVARFDNPGKLGAVRWSPSGDQLALISAAHPDDPREGRLMVADARGGALREVLPSYLGHVHDLAWRDVDTLLYLGDRGLGSELGAVETSPSGAETTAAGRHQVLAGGDGGPIWRSLSVAGDSVALIGSTPEHPSEVYVLTPRDAVPRRSTESNPWLAERRLARQEPLRFTARDGLLLEGVLTWPLEPGDRDRVPLVLDVHSGPEDHDSHGWATSSYRPTQVLAARGLAVLQLNYRGSTGRGVTFSELGRGDAGGKEFDDLLDAIDHLVEKGWVDPERVGISGFSYGGYAAAWGATRHSQRFAAAVMGGGLSNHLSYAGTTDFVDENARIHWGARPWEAAGLYLERSPIRHVAGAGTPLLALHGEDDPRVPPAQAVELVRALEIAGRAPARLVLYPGEGHGMRRSAARFDYSLRLLRWLEHYLLGPGDLPPPIELDPWKLWGETEE